MNVTDIFSKLPEYAEHIIIHSTDERRPMGVIKFTRDIREDSEKLSTLLTDYHCVEEAAIKSVSWSSPDMAGAVDYTILEDDGETYDRSALFVITHVY